MRDPAPSQCTTAPGIDQSEHSILVSGPITDEYSLQASLVLVSQSQGVDHGKAGGRIAFSLPAQELPGVQETVEQAKEKVLTPLISLDTPGKATVQVVDQSEASNTVN